MYCVVVVGAGAGGSVVVVERGGWRGGRGGGAVDVAVGGTGELVRGMFSFSLLEVVAAELLVGAVVLVSSIMWNCLEGSYERRWGP